MLCTVSVALYNEVAESAFLGQTAKVYRLVPPTPPPSTTGTLPTYYGAITTAMTVRPGLCVRP